MRGESPSSRGRGRTWAGTGPLPLFETGPSDASLERTKGKEAKLAGGVQRRPPALTPALSATEAFFQYSPGKLRGNQYKKMLTKEELEEEQR